MINLKNLDKWLHLMEGEMVSFAKVEPRTVRVEVNAPFETRLYVTRNEEPVFLALVEGLEVVSFGVDGPFTLYGDSQLSLYSSELESVSFEVLEPEIFTEIAERRARNPELEYMMQKMQQNMERRLAKAEAELADRFQSMNEEIEQHVNSRTVVAKPAAAEPEPAPVGDKPGQDAGNNGGAASGVAPVEPAK